MPRANRHFLPGHVWHITHRCHKQEFLLKFAKDRERWRYWLFEARKRYGLYVLNYITTSNHIHLLVLDQGNGEIAQSMQLIAGRTAQEYNLRKHRKGAYWEDRYHATAVDTQTYLARCMRYIDLNMVRAGVVTHPQDWKWCGYCEIQSPPQRYAVINTAALLQLFGLAGLHQFQKIHNSWIDSDLENSQLTREASWSESIAVGHKLFVENVQSALCIHGQHRAVELEDEKYALKEVESAYTALFGPEKTSLSPDNTYLWQLNPD